MPWSSVHSAIRPYGSRCGSVDVPPAARTWTTAAARSLTCHTGTTAGAECPPLIPTPPFPSYKCSPTPPNTPRSVASRVRPAAMPSESATCFPSAAESPPFTVVSHE